MSELRFALRSDVGLLRERNEDFAFGDGALRFFVVADGMGGHVGGDVASRVAVETAIASIRAHPDAKRVSDAAQALVQATADANSAVLEHAERNDLGGMGTTLTLCRVHKRTAVLVSVGDTRAYVLTRTRFEALTTDQTVVAAMVRNGLITPRQALDHPDRHVLTQAIGTQMTLEPGVTTRRLSRGARLLLSSDGLHDIVPRREVARACREADLEAAVDALVAAAHAHGAPDNVTALLIET